MKRYIKSSVMSISDEDLETRTDIARHSDDIEMLSILSQDPNLWVRDGVANNPNTPVEILLKLAEDDYSRIRESVALRWLGDMDERVALVLSKDPEDIIRKIIAAGDDTPQSVLDSMADDKSVRVLTALAENPNISDDLMYRLAEHQNWRVRKGVAKNVSVTEYVLMQLAEDHNDEVVEAVVDNKNTTADILDKLADADSDSYILSGVLTHPNVTTDIIEKLTHSRFDTIRELAVRFL